MEQIGRYYLGHFKALKKLNYKICTQEVPGKKREIQENWEILHPIWHTLLVPHNLPSVLVSDIMSKSLCIHYHMWVA